jgi:hypothetical protein
VLVNPPVTRFCGGVAEHRATLADGHTIAGASDIVAGYGPTGGNPSSKAVLFDDSDHSIVLHDPRGIYPNSSRRDAKNAQALDNRAVCRGKLHPVTCDRPAPHGDALEPARRWRRHYTERAGPTEPGDRKPPRLILTKLAVITRQVPFVEVLEVGEMFLTSLYEPGLLIVWHFSISIGPSSRES